MNLPYPIVLCLHIINVDWVSHWLVNGFVVFGAPYMVHDIYAMYLSHYHVQRVRGQSRSYSSHSLQTVKAFVCKEWMLILHHLALLLVFMPITLVSMGRSDCHACGVFVDGIGPSREAVQDC